MSPSSARLPCAGRMFVGLRAGSGRDLVPEVDVRLLGIEPDVFELAVDRVENSRQRSEEVLVPAQLDDGVEAMELLHLGDRQTEGELVESLEVGDDDATPIGHGANSTAKPRLLSGCDRS